MFVEVICDSLCKCTKRLASHPIPWRLHAIYIPSKYKPLMVAWAACGSMGLCMGLCMRKSEAYNFHME